jgi:hypothetical protein
MFITKKSIPRRTLLRGAGVALGLPLLDAMLPAATALARRPPFRRVGSSRASSPTAPRLGPIGFPSVKGPLPAELPFIWSRSSPFATA